MRRFLMTGLVQLNMLFAVVASAQSSMPQAAHHPEATSKPPIPKAGETPGAMTCHCPMMTHGADGGPAMHQHGGQGSSAMAGHAHPMKGGMQDCADMKASSPPKQQGKTKP